MADLTEQVKRHLQFLTRSPFKAHLPQLLEVMHTNERAWLRRRKLVNRSRSRRILSGKKVNKFCFWSGKDDRRGRVITGRLPGGGGAHGVSLPISCSCRFLLNGKRFSTPRVAAVRQDVHVELPTRHGPVTWREEPQPAMKLREESVSSTAVPSTTASPSHKHNKRLVQL